MDKTEQKHSQDKEKATKGIILFFIKGYKNIIKIDCAFYIL